MNLKSDPQDVLAAMLSTEDTPEKDIPMPRFGVNFRIKALDAPTIERINEQSTFGTKRDELKFGLLLIKEACVVPDWNDPQLKVKYPNAATPLDIITKRLLAGEIARLGNEITAHSGFSDDPIEMAKN